jgi:hypothetical protein
MEADIASPNPTAISTELKGKSKRLSEGGVSHGACVLIDAIRAAPSDAFR